MPNKINVDKLEKKVYHTFVNYGLMLARMVN